MLKLEYLYENYDLAKFALENWDHDADSLDECLRHFRISSNAVYPFRSQGKLCFLRLSPVPEKIGDNLRGELEFLNYLKDKNYPAAVPIASKSGEWVAELDSPWGGYYASAFWGVSGVPIEDTDCGGPILFAYGQALGRLHQLSSAYSPKVRKWACWDALSWIKDVLEEYKAPARMLTEWADVRQALGGLPQTRDAFGLVHYDFEPDNVFWDEESQRCAAIDFEDGMYHFFLVDVEQALDELTGIVPAQWRSGAKDAFLRGYESVRTLEPELDEKLRLMRRFCNLYSYARLVRSVAGQPPHEPDWMVELRAKLQEKIARLESGVTGV